MLKFVDVFGQHIFFRDMLINIGSIISIMTVLILYIVSYRKRGKAFTNILLPIIIEIVIVFTIGTALAIVIRRLCFPLSGAFTSEFLKMWKDGGTHFIGIVIASCVFLPLIFGWIYKENAAEMLDIVAFFFPIQHIFNRLGCFSEGCCYGIPMSGALSVKYPDEVLSYRVFPSQLFEAFCMVILLVLIIVLFVKKKHIFYITMAGFGLSILVSECFMDKRGTVMYMGLTVIQLSALLLIIITLFSWRIGKRKKKHLLVWIGITAVSLQTIGIDVHAGKKYDSDIVAAKLPTEETDEGISQSWYLDNIDCQCIWSEIENNGKLPGEGVVIAIIDTGLSSTVKCLQDALWINEAELSGEEGIDDDNNGYVDDIYGLNLANRYAYQTDTVGHGTEIAGLIAMQPGDGGGVGVAYGAKIMPIKVSQDTNYDEESVIEAINYAVSMGADVINMSFACYSPSEKLEAAVREASKSCVLVAAAGNESFATVGELSEQELETFGYGCKDAYPAAWDCCIGVMASDIGNQLATFTNWDQSKGESVKYNIVAPGQSLYTVSRGERYTTVKGTSYSTAIVSAAVAVYIGITGNKNNAQQTTTDFISLMKQTISFSCGEDIYTYPRLSFIDMNTGFEIGEQSGEELQDVVDDESKVDNPENDLSDKTNDEIIGTDGGENNEVIPVAESEKTEIDNSPISNEKTDKGQVEEITRTIEQATRVKTTTEEIIKIEEKTTTEEDIENQPLIVKTEKKDNVKFGKITQDKKRITVKLKQVPEKGKVTLKICQIRKKNGRKKANSCKFSINDNIATVKKSKLRKNKLCKGKAVLYLEWKYGKNNISKKKTIYIH